MSELENDLRATAEEIATHAERLTRIEDDKVRLGARHPRLAELSAESEQIARRLVPMTTAERQLTRQIAQTEPPDA